MNRLVALLPLAILSGCGGGDGEEAAAIEPVALVRTAPATLGATAERTILYGIAEPAAGGERTLAAPVEVILDRIVAPSGTRVAAGQLIATLKPSRTTATDLARARADATAAEAAYARARRLRGDGLASDADVETARAAAETASAARANLGMGRSGMELRAPVAGIVQGLGARSGDQIAAGTTIASVAVNGQLRVRLGIDPAVAQRVQPGQALQLDAMAGGSPVTVRVSGVDTQVDQTTRLAAVYAPLPRGFAVGPGEALRGSLSLAAQTGGITIPYAALLDDGGRSYVFVVKGGVAHERGVSPGSSSGDRIQILKGLHAGDIVVTQGGTALEDGMKVTERGGPR